MQNTENNKKHKTQPTHNAKQRKAQNAKKNRIKHKIQPNKTQNTNYKTQQTTYTTKKSTKYVQKLSPLM